jgi:hypothetical protein
MLLAAVQTTGINWESVIATCASIAFITAVALIPTVRWLKRTLVQVLKTTIHMVIDEVVTPQLAAIRTDVAALKNNDADLDRRVAYLEGHSGTALGGRRPATGAPTGDEKPHP